MERKIYLFGNFYVIDWWELLSCIISNYIHKSHKRYSLMTPWIFRSIQLLQFLIFLDWIFQIPQRWWVLQWLQLAYFCGTKFNHLADFHTVWIREIKLSRQSWLYSTICISYLLPLIYCKKYLVWRSMTDLPRRALCWWNFMATSYHHNRFDPVLTNFSFN